MLQRVFLSNQTGMCPSRGQYHILFLQLLIYSIRYGF